MRLIRASPYRPWFVVLQGDVTTDLATATAAGMVVSTATVISVLVYAGAVWTWRALVADPERLADSSLPAFLARPGGRLTEGSEAR